MSEKSTADFWNKCLKTVQLTSETDVWKQYSWLLKQMSENSTADFWNKCLKTVPLTSETNVWKQHSWLLKQMSENSTADFWNKCLKTVQLTSETNVWKQYSWLLKQMLSVLIFKLLVPFSPRFLSNETLEMILAKWNPRNDSSSTQ